MCHQAQRNGRRFLPGGASTACLPHAVPVGRCVVIQCASIFHLLPQETHVLISSAYAQTAAAAADPTGGLMQMLPIVAMFAVLYFLMVRPQMKKAKEHKALLEALAKGDEVVTQGGLAGRITKISDNFISIEIAPNVEIQMQKPAITLVLPKGTLKSQ
jgi:preprotein translocase subunit YajC